MTHKMNLKNWAFNSIKKGQKKIEMRLFDEKRQLINVGDDIEFSNENHTENLMVEVIALHKFENFSGIYQKFPKEWLGYESDEQAKPEDMEEFYPKQLIEKLGVLGIEIKLK